MSKRTYLDNLPPSPASTHLVIQTAVRIATRYTKTPAPEELQRDFGMSRATAYRWVAAFREVSQKPLAKRN